MKLKTIKFKAYASWGRYQDTFGLPIVQTRVHVLDADRVTEYSNEEYNSIFGSNRYHENHFWYLNGRNFARA